MNVMDRLAYLRHQMMVSRIGVVLLDDADPHLGEYVPEGCRLRTFLSGFDGSFGRLVVARDRAALWTDPRYYLQAEIQLHGMGIELITMESGLSISEWIIDCLGFSLYADCQTVACDGWQFSYDELQGWYRDFLNAGVLFKSDFEFLQLFAQERPSFPKGLVRLYDLSYSGESFLNKREALLSLMSVKGVDAIFLSSLDEIVWTLNLRGDDLPYNPFFSAYFYLAVNEAVLFVDLDKLSDLVVEYLVKSGISICAYNEVQDFVPVCKRMMIDPKRINGYLGGVFSKLGLVVWSDSIVAPIKAIKNRTQIKNLHLVAVQDGVAVLRTLYWLERTLVERSVSELEVGQVLVRFRSDYPYYMEESFAPIVAHGENAAIVHYHPTRSGHSVFGAKGVLLIDSGGQYLEATTDSARTILLGEASDQLRRDYTLVLKGHIALSMACFPKGTPGYCLDSLARQFLWKEGLDYGHGTGHGIGAYASVHEGPQSIRSDANQTPLQAGMLLSNEPGLYRKGLYGIRIENMVLVVPSSEVDFLKFETITLLPYDQRLIEVGLLNLEEREWIDCYHKLVYDKLSVFLSDEERCWLRCLTESING